MSNCSELSRADVRSLLANVIAVHPDDARDDDVEICTLDSFNLYNVITPVTPVPAQVILKQIMLVYRTSPSKVHGDEGDEGDESRGQKRARAIDKCAGCSGDGGSFRSAGMTPTGRPHLCYDDPMLSLSYDLVERIITMATEDVTTRGVPLLMVIRNEMCGVDTHTLQRAYLKLPDPNNGVMDNARFEEEGYAFADLLELLMQYAGYDHETDHPTFLEIGNDDAIPEGLQLPDPYSSDDDEGENIFEFAREVCRFQPPGEFATGKEQLAFPTLPTFRSHIAIVLTVKVYS